MLTNNFPTQRKRDMGWKYTNSRGNVCFYLRHFKKKTLPSFPMKYRVTGNLKEINT